MYTFIRYRYILHQGYISSRSVSQASSTMVGTGEKDVIWHFESKCDEYCIFLCEVFICFA